MRERERERYKKENKMKKGDKKRTVLTVVAVYVLVYTGLTYI